MTRTDNAHFQNMMQQGRCSPQEVVSEIQEIAKVSEKLGEIDLLMKNMTGQANLLSRKAVEAARTRNTDSGLILIAHDACKFAEFSNEQSTAIGNMFMEIKEYTDKINGSINKVLNSFGVVDQGVKPAGKQEDTILRATGIGQVNEAVKVVSELTQKMEENISSIVQSVLRIKI